VCLNNEGLDVKMRYKVLPLHSLISTSLQPFLLSSLQGQQRRGKTSSVRSNPVVEMLCSIYTSTSLPFVLINWWGNKGVRRVFAVTWAEGRRIHIEQVCMLGTSLRGTSSEHHFSAGGHIDSSQAVGCDMTAGYVWALAALLVAAWIREWEGREGRW